MRTLDTEVVRQTGEDNNSVQRTERSLFSKASGNLLESHAKFLKKRNSNDTMSQRSIIEELRSRF